ncbi:uncharacterized protein PB18E9.04c-like [Nicotiana sylvestris]|uniref:uncharacterized protein PB18E9.04c-like n=1 Tax=Nicotiana sylvestris TaxID=4096 RepID=UPI00388CE871
MSFPTKNKANHKNTSGNSKEQSNLLSGTLSSISLNVKSTDKQMSFKFPNRNSSKNYIAKNPSPLSSPTTENKFQALVNPSNQECMVLDMAPSPNSNYHVENTAKDQLNTLHGTNYMPTPLTNQISNSLMLHTSPNDALIPNNLINHTASLANPCIDNKVHLQHLSQVSPIGQQMVKETIRITGTKSTQSPTNTTGSSIPQSMQIEVINIDPPRTQKSIVTPSENSSTSHNINHPSSSKYAQNSSIPKKALSSSPNLMASTSPYNGQPSDSSGSTNKQSNLLCSTIPPSRPSTPLLDRASINGACNIIQHDIGWAGNSDSPPKFSLPCPASIGRGCIWQ